MFKEIKQRLLDNPDCILNILEAYDFYKPRIMNNERRCGLYDGSNPTAIRIRLNNNDNLFVADYSRSLSYDIINYIIKVKGASFKDVLYSIKSELGIDSYYDLDFNRSVFGGFYDHLNKGHTDLITQTYPESVLQSYISAYNAKFALDNINFDAQNYFELGYDVESQRITIPVRNQYGEIIGIKGRATWEVKDDEPKYLYLIPCPMSATLFGFAQNYQFLQDTDVYLFEAEKSVMQAFSYGFRNAVALGSNSLSPMQCKLLMELQPKRIIFMLDKGLDLKNTFADIERLKPFMAMKDIKILYWDWRKSSLPDKASPSDYGKDILKHIVDNELREYEL